MAWSETMLIIQHFYNVFDIDRRLTEVEYKAPLVARSVNGAPEGKDVSELTPGTLWFIQDGDSPTIIKSLTVLKDDHTFAEPIPLNIDLTEMLINDELAAIVSSMELTAENYYDIIKLMLEILVTVPVKRGGTGRTSVGVNKVLVGDSNNTFKEIGFDSAPTNRSENLLSSGAIFTKLKEYAEKKHDSTSADYGVGTYQKYGHLKITDDYETLTEDSSSTAISVTGLKNLLDSIQSYLNMFQVIDTISEEDKNNGVIENAKLFSGCISAYKTDDMKENELRLVDSYFSIRPNTTGDHTLIIN